MNVKCPHCQQPIKPPAKVSGQPLQCPACGGLATMPAARATPKLDDWMTAPAVSSRSEVTIQWRSRKRRTIGLRPILVGAAVCLLAVAAVWMVGAVNRWIHRVRQAQAETLAAAPDPAPAPPEPDPSRPTWLPDAALHAQLGDEVGIQHYRLRIPRNFSQFSVRQPAWLPQGGAYFANSWLQTPERGAMIVASVTKYPRGQSAGDDLKAALERFYNRMQRNVRATNLIERNSEIGFLAGEEFIKASFSGRIRFDRDLPRVDRSGQVLIHLEGNSEVAIYYLCNRDADRELFRQLEASLLTLRSSQH